MTFRCWCLSLHCDSEGLFYLQPAIVYVDGPVCSKCTSSVCRRCDL